MTFDLLVTFTFLWDIYHPSLVTIVQIGAKLWEIIETCSKKLTLGSERSLTPASDLWPFRWPSASYETSTPKFKVEILLNFDTHPTKTWQLSHNDVIWQPSWKMAAILEFFVARIFFWKSDLNSIFVPNFMLLSSTERFIGLSAALLVTTLQITVIIN